MSVKRLTELAEANNIDLDGTVHDIASEIASVVNNRNLAGQIEWLVLQIGYGRTAALIRNAAGTSTPAGHPVQNP